MCDTKSAKRYSEEQIAAYHAVLDYEASRRGLKGEMDTIWDGMAGGLGGKSALLNRIADGRLPLVYPPPCSFSYPWYDVIEGDGPWEVQVDAGATLGTFLRGMLGQDRLGLARSVSINQSLWRVLRRRNDDCLIVSYGDWRTMGFRWKLQKETIPALSAVKAICSWHDPSLSRITTLNQLQAEQLWHVEERYARLRLAVEPVSSESVSGVRSWFEHSMREADAQRAQELVSARRAQGLSDWPTLPERQYEAQQMTEAWLKEGYSVDSAGNLLAVVWRLHRIRPGVDGPANSIYLDIQAKGSDGCTTAMDEPGSGFLNEAV